MKSKIITIFAFGLIAVVLLALVGGLRLGDRSDTAFANGDLTIDWGVPSGDPIFVVENLLPGDSEVGEVDVTNGSGSPRSITVRGTKTSETGNISSVLEITISEGATILYGPKTLDQFFADSSDLGGIALTTLGPGDSATYTFTVQFPTSAGNEFQGKKVVFDLHIGIAVEIPAECQDIEFSGNPILGTDDDDRINGTTGNDLIVLFEGDDRSFAFLGDDCIIGGPGNDELRGEVGRDIIFGNEGDDLLIGGNDEDKIFGGEGNDSIRGENSDDYIEGNEGADTITGGNGDDIINGGDGDDTISAENGEDIVNGGGGNDTIDGGANNDEIHGDEGDDTLSGKAGDDTLIGDGGDDTANGLSGTDTCDAETESNCEL